MGISLLSMADLYQNFPQLIGLFDWPVAGIGVFYYCYVRSMVGLGNSRHQAWHFVPISLWTMWLIWMRLSMPYEVLQSTLARGDGGMFVVLLIIFQVVTGAYIVAALYRLKQYRKRVREIYASTRNRDLIWLSWLTGAIVALLLVWMPATTMGGPWRYGLYVGRLTTLYFLGWFGIRQAPVFLAPRLKEPRSPGSDESPPAPIITVPLEIEHENQRVPVPIPAEPTDAEKYARSGMTDAAQQLIGERLTRRMSREKDYLETDIKLTDLADRIGTSPQLLSQYLNHALGLSFFDYINGLRVAEVQAMMRNPLHADSTLLELAFSAGFNSKSTFNASFKQISGTTPSNWRNVHVQTSVPIG